MKNLKRYILLTGLILFSSFVYSQCNNFRTEERGRGFGIFKISDSELIFGGEFKFGIFLEKINENLETKWRKEILLPNTANMGLDLTGSSIKKSSNGTFIHITGISDDGEWDNVLEPFICKVDTSGKEVFCKSYFTGHDAKGISTVEGQNGNIICLARQSFPGDTIVLIEINETNGELIKIKKLPFENNFLAFDIHRVEDHFYIFGSKNANQRGISPVIQKVNASFEIVEEYFIDRPLGKTLYAQTAIKTLDDNFIVSGFSYDSLMLSENIFHAEISSTGMLEKLKFAPEGVSARLYSSYITPKQEYCVVGEKYNSPDIYKAGTIFKMNQGFNFDWSKTFFEFPSDPGEKKATSLLGLTQMNDCLFATGYYFDGSFFKLILFSTTNGITDIKNNLLEKKLKIFPNPTGSFINIEVSDFLLFESEILIFDQTGKLVSKQKQRIKSSIEIDTYNLKKGIYFLKVISKKGVLEGKFIKN